MAWPAIEELTTGRLRLEPLSTDHSARMVPVLADPALYEFTGGTPPTLEQLRQQYAAQSRGCSVDGAEWWLNWIVALRDTGAAVGYVQATVERTESRLQADVAWAITPTRQGQGLAGEAAQAMVNWLVTVGVHRFFAHIKPGHLASEGVAARLGMAPTGILVDGETRWQTGDL